MKRNEFLKSFGISALGLGTLSFKDAIERKSVKIYDNYLRGTFAYDLKMVFNELKVGQKVLLIRELDNKYDKYAIGVFYKQQQLGYIAAYENIVLANMIDLEVSLTATISCLNGVNTDSKEIAIEVFCDLISPKPLLISEMEKRADDEDDLYRNKIDFN